MIAVVIPALNPIDGLPEYCRSLRAITDAPIVLVDDGSRPDRVPVFEACLAVPGTSLLRHEVNCGKGRALKTAFAHLLHGPEPCEGCVTADADGQHTPEDVVRVLNALRASPDALVLGCRDFTGPDIPLRSRFGNRFILLPFRFATGHRFRDTQTGLRGIGTAFMRELLDVPGERFDFETRMLLAIGDRPLAQIPIRTVYEEGNPTSHFRPVRDSLHLFGIVLSAPQCRKVQFAIFALVGILSWALDQGLFSLLYRHGIPDGVPHRLLLAVAGARAVSLVFNFLANRHIVFASSPSGGFRPFLRYLLLAAPIMLASWGLTKCATDIWPEIKLVEILKIVADLILFVVSFLVQKLFVFRAPEIGDAPVASHPSRQSASEAAPTIHERH